MAHRTWGEVKAFVGASLHEDHTDPVLTTLLPRWANQVIDRIRRFAYWRWDQSSIDLSWPAQGSVGEGSILYLPSYVYRVQSMYPQNSSLGTRRQVAIISPGEFDLLRPRGQWSWDYLVIHGYYGVEADNPSEAQLTVAVGSEGSGAQTVVIEGLDSEKRLQKETISVVSGGSSPTTKTWAAGEGGVRNIYLTGTATGSVVTVSNSGTTIEKLDSASEVAHEHLRSALYAQVNGPGTYTLRFWRRLIPPVPTDSEIVPIPAEFQDLVETGIMEKLQHWRGDKQGAAILEGAFRRGLREFVAWDRRDPGVRRRYRSKRQWGTRPL